MHNQKKETRSQSATADCLFRYENPGAKQVFVTGSFCSWEPEKFVMQKQKDGHFETCIPLSHGRHEYRYIVDGDWVNDPFCSNLSGNPFGGTNCVVEV